MQPSCVSCFNVPFCIVCKENDVKEGRNNILITTLQHHQFGLLLFLWFICCDFPTQCLFTIKHYRKISFADLHWWNDVVIALHRDWFYSCYISHVRWVCPFPCFALDSKRCQKHLWGTKWPDYCQALLSPLSTYFCRAIVREFHYYISYYPGSS